MVGKETKTAILIGLALIALGLWGRFSTGTTSITALIPAFFGLPIAILGFLGRNPQRLKMSMHVVAILALLGIIGTYTVIIDLLGGGEMSVSVISRGLMLLLCAIMLIISIVSFVQVRRNRQKVEAG
ncbi:MAG: hypothetical protein AAF702_06510 [Chloroflexota bacterium]